MNERPWITWLFQPRKLIFSFDGSPLCQYSQGSFLAAEYLAPIIDQCGDPKVF